jgi:hypothetical protein
MKANPGHEESLDEENRKLKQLVAEQALDIVGFKAVLSKNVWSAV